MNTQLSEELIKTLQTLDTPTVCNALELLIPKRRGYGFTRLPTRVYAPRATAHGGLCANRDDPSGASI